MACKLLNGSNEVAFAMPPIWPGWAKAETELVPILSLQAPVAAEPTVVKLQPVPDGTDALTIAFNDTACAPCGAITSSKAVKTVRAQKMEGR